MDEKFNNLKRHFTLKVLPDFQEYLESKEINEAGDEKDLRLASHTATSLYHFREHFPKEEKKSKNQIKKIFPDYALLADVVNALKHHEIDQNDPQISSSNSISESIYFTEYEDEKGIYRRVDKKIIIKLNDGSTRILDDILVGTMNMWIDELSKLGVIKDFPHFSSFTDDPLPRQNEGEAANFNMKITKGLDFKMEGSLRKYNYEKRKAENIDLIGGIRLKEPLPEFPKEEFKVVQISAHTVEGQKKVVPLPILELEEKHLTSLTSQKEVKDYLFNLAIEKGYLVKVY